MPSPKLNARWADDFSAFFGREKELKALTSLFETQAHVTIWGSGGIGKSRLALRFCELIEHQRTVYRCNLLGVQDAQGFYSALGDALELPAGEDAKGLVLEKLANDKDAFLLLDHFDDALVNAASCVVELSTRLRSLSMLITSRERLNLESEEVLHLEALEKIEHARALFIARAQKQSYAPLELDALLIALEKVPLAIVLAAAQSALYSPKEILKKLKGGTLLESRQRDIPERHRSLSASIEASFSTLKPNEKAVLAFASLYRASFSIDDLMSFDDDAANIVLTFLDRSLAYRLPSEQQPRFKCLEMIRRFAHERFLSGSESEKHAAYTKAVEHLLKDSASCALNGAQIYEDVRRLPNFEHAAALGFQLANIFMREGPAQKALQIFDEIASEEGLFNEEERALAHLRRARYALVYGANEGARSDIEAALKLHPALDNQVETAQTRALYERRLGDAVKAQNHYAHAAELAPENGQKARVWSDAAGHAFEIEDFDAAAAAFERALTFTNTAETSAVQAEIHTNYALFHQAQGAFENAEALLTNALLAHQRSANRRYEGITYGDLAGLAFEEGLYVKALPLYDRALDVLGELGDKRHSALLQSARAACLRVLGQKGQTPTFTDVAHLEEAVHIYASILCEREGQEKAKSEAAQSQQSDEARLAQRIVKRVHQHRQNAEVLMSFDAQTFMIGDKTYDCKKRLLLARILLALVRDAFTKRHPALSKEELISKGWPDEKADAESSLNRLYVALSALRKKGLKNLIEAKDGHYRLSQSESVFFVQDA